MNDGNLTDRGQAYTLEGFIGAMIVLMAILFALQSVVIMPTTGGSVDRTVQAQMQQEVQDSLVVAAANETENLSYMVRYWDVDDDERDFDGADRSDQDGQYVYTTDDFAGNFTLGAVLHDRFTDSGRNYNVELHYMNETEPDSKPLVYQGRPSSNAVTATHTVALYENQTVTSSEGQTLGDTDEDNRAIPELETGDGPLYNVVEVRVVVW